LADGISSSAARETVDAIRRDITIDWTVRESVRAEMRALVKRILRKLGSTMTHSEPIWYTGYRQADAQHRAPAQHSTQHPQHSTAMTEPSG
jgi:type I restriction enzyme, R subunit